MQIRSSPLIKMPTQCSGFYAASHVRLFSWLMETRLQRRKIKMQTPVRGASLFSNQGAAEREEIEMQSWVHINDEWFSAAPAASVDDAGGMVPKRPAAHNYITESCCGKVLGALALCPSAHHTRLHFCLKQMSLCLTGHVPISFRHSRDNRRSSAQNTFIYIRVGIASCIYAGFNFCSLYRRQVPLLALPVEM